jgi:hypothetical protein
MSEARQEPGVSIMTENRLQPANQPPPTPDDAWLESLLRQDASATSYVDDGNFTASVMNQLPERTGSSPYRWIVPAMGLLGFLIGLVGLSGGEYLSLNLVNVANMKSVSLRTLLVAALPLGLLYWLALGAAWQEK